VQVLDRRFDPDWVASGPIDVLPLTSREDIVTEERTRAALIAHLTAKVREQDWAAVSDAANDLRNFEILAARSPSARADRPVRLASASP